MSRSGAWGCLSWGAGRREDPGGPAWLAGCAGITGRPLSSWGVGRSIRAPAGSAVSDDERLAALVARGDVGAFEALYDRHHAALLAFCRHMAAAVRTARTRSSRHSCARTGAARRPVPDTVRPWLFAIARNRCRTLLAARRDAAVPRTRSSRRSTDSPSDVGRRADLRELVADLGRLPEDQRGALVLYELGDLSHAEIATVIGCAPEKVKALVFQARTALIAEREARATPCEEIRGQLESARGGVLRRAPLRRHLRQCEPCSSYKLLVAYQRTGLAQILPVAPSAGLKTAILGGAAATTAGGGAAAAAARPRGGGAVITSGGGAIATGAVAVKTLTAKVVIGAVVAGAGVTGAAVVEDHEPSPARAEAPAADRSPAAAAPARPRITRRRRRTNIVWSPPAAATSVWRPRSAQERCPAPAASIRSPATGRAPSTARRAPRPDRPAAAPAHEPRGHSAPHARRRGARRAPRPHPAPRGGRRRRCRDRGRQVATPPATTHRRRPRTPPPEPAAPHARAGRKPTATPEPEPSTAVETSPAPPAAPEPAPPSGAHADPDADAAALFCCRPCAQTIA